MGPQLRSEVLWEPGCSSETMSQNMDGQSGSGSMGTAGDGNQMANGACGCGMMGCPCGGCGMGCPGCMGCPCGMMMPMMMPLG